MSKCVVLVPVQRHIEPACEAGLAQLEKRGYEVRRVCGYAALDQGRNLAAANAMVDGFHETMWIGADVAFEPDDVDRLRNHNLPICGAICPKNGCRDLAVQVLPETDRIVFGIQGGLLEVRYAAAGFLHVRCKVYEHMQRNLELPVCNQRFEAPLVPYFQPLVVPDEGGHWYLPEDFAFCERARQCGYSIMVDTTIRLRHIGAYAYSWEEAGRNVDRYATFHFYLNRKTNPWPPGAGATPAARGSADRDEFEESLRMLMQAHPWPVDPPAVEAKPKKGWLSPGTREMLRRVIRAEHRLIVELGSFLGLSTRFIADLAPKAAVLAVDHWQGSAEHLENPHVARLLPKLYETFLVNCWEYRGRIVPVRTYTIDGLQEVAQCGLSPDVVFVDADHRYEAVAADLQTALDFFPDALIVGDDWKWVSVRRAVTDIARRHNRRIENLGNAWRFV